MGMINPTIALLGNGNDLLAGWLEVWRWLGYDLGYHGPERQRLPFDTPPEFAIPGVHSLPLSWPPPAWANAFPIPR